MKYFCFEVSILCLLLSAGDTAGSCGDPGIPSHGSREQTDFKIRSKVYFSCSEGFDLIGSSERMCFPNGTWSGTQPFCKRKNILFTEPMKIPHSHISTLALNTYVPELKVKLFYSCSPQLSSVATPALQVMEEYTVWMEQHFLTQLFTPVWMATYSMAPPPGSV